jgi:hypothetical protein
MLYVHLCQECHLKSYINCIIWTIFNNKFSNTEANLLPISTVSLFVQVEDQDLPKKESHSMTTNSSRQNPNIFAKTTQQLEISNTISDMQPLVGMFTKLWKITNGFVMYACPHGTAWLPLDGFSWNLKFWGIFENLLRKFKFYVKSDMNNGDLTWKPM